MLPAIAFDQNLKNALVEFFTKYNEAQGKEFRAIRFASAQRGVQLTHEAIKEASNSHGNGKARIRSTAARRR